MGGAVGWIVAWNRFQWLTAVQHHTFVFLWSGYILLVNGLSFKHAVHYRRENHFFSPSRWRLENGNPPPGDKCSELRFFLGLVELEQPCQMGIRNPLCALLQVFEMPLLGYLGYLPFGLECMAVGEKIRAIETIDQLGEREDNTAGR